MTDQPATESTGTHLSISLQVSVESTSLPLQATDTASTLTFTNVSQGQHIFQALVILIGVVGTLANGLVLYALCASNQPKNKSVQSVNMLFVNQMALDLFSSFWLVIVYTLKISQLYLTGSFGYYLCVFVVSETVVWYGLVGSSVNLAAIAVERYVMIVHPVWHKNHYSPWMVYSAIAFTWINGLLANQILASTSTVVIDGQCNFGSIYISDIAKATYGVWYFFSYFGVIFVLFVYCYGRIISVVRHQALQFPVPIINGQPAATATAIATAEQRALRTQANVIKTAIIISGLFVVCWLPADTYSLIAYTTNVNLTFVTELYYITVFVALFNVCLNPFIYAAKYDLVRKYWLRFVPCRNNAVLHSETQPAAQPNVITVRPASQRGVIVMTTQFTLLTRGVSLTTFI